MSGRLLSESAYLLCKFLPSTHGQELTLCRFIDEGLKFVERAFFMPKAMEERKKE